MSAVIVLVLLAAAGWFLTTVAGGPRLGGQEPIGSVSEFTRAMKALDPARPVPGVQMPLGDHRQ